MFLRRLDKICEGKRLDVQQTAIRIGPNEGMAPEKRTLHYL